jgi:hypothetical protein
MMQIVVNFSNRQFDHYYLNTRELTVDTLLCVFSHLYSEE